MYLNNVIAWSCAYYVFILAQGTGGYSINPAEEFTRYRLAQPTVYHRKTKPAISSTKEKADAHRSEVTVGLDIDGEEYLLDLRLNEDLLTDNHVFSYQRHGETVLHNPTKAELDLCQYRGEVRSKPGSWVAVSTCDGVRGLLYDGKDMRYIEPAQGGPIDSQHFIYNHSDLKVTNGTAMLLKTFSHSVHQDYDKEYVKSKRIKRKTKNNYYNIHEPFNTNMRSRYVELVLVADNSEYRRRGRNMNVIHKQMKDLANIINSMFAPLNIFIALVGVKVWNEWDEIHLNDNATVTLDSFLRYRETKLLTELPNDHAQLLTNRKFNKGVVGKAYIGMMCTVSHSGGCVSYHTEVIGILAATIAHEMGHNFGMEHDSEVCQCSGDKCMMHPSSTSIVPTHWSDCSVKSLANYLHRGIDYCLRNKPKRFFLSPTCGNGFVEVGEQCDCGSEKEKTRAACKACCDPHTCMLRSNPSCAAGTCCDFQTCRLKPKSTLCRAAVGECDLPEHCSGRSEFCPSDVFKMDTTPCEDNQAYCSRGRCRSHTSQCRFLWGPSSTNGDQKCYSTFNIKANNRTGNCGYDSRKKMYASCNKADQTCGRLHCKRFSNEMTLSTRSHVSYVQGSIIVNDKVFLCHSTRNDMDPRNEDLSMVPDGAKCGEDKMCMNQRCVSVASIRNRIADKKSVCPSVCSGHGVCNSEGNCHCDPGFDPPLCALPSGSGSYDSGPAGDVNFLNKFRVAMYIIFLGILPFILLATVIIYVLKTKKKLWWKEENAREKRLMSKNISKLKKEDIEIIRHCNIKIIMKPFEKTDV